MCGLTRGFQGGDNFHFGFFGDATCGFVAACMEHTGIFWEVKGWSCIDGQ